MPFDKSGMAINEINANNLIESFYKAQQCSNWKCSVQKYEAHLLRNIYKAEKSLKDGTYRQMPFYEFTLRERGKIRRIKSLHISDRVIQRAYCDGVLTPSLSKYLIYDNGASQEGKGISFTRSRLIAHLSKFLREHQDGYILQIDFAKFFDNIPHEKLCEVVKPHIKDYELFEYLIGTFKIDVSYMTDEEYLDAQSVPFNMLKYEPCYEKQKFLNRSVGIGSQISQIVGIYYPTKIDTYCKCVRGCKYYGRYMDDIYIIHQDKEFLKSVLDGIKETAREMGLFISDDKTRITKLSKGFSYLQIKYSITPTGHIIKRPSAKSFTRERRRLKAYKGLLERGELSMSQIANAYRSWRGNILQFDAYRSVKELDRLYQELFGGLK